MNDYLVGGFKHDFDVPFHLWDNPNPNDELHHFSRWLLQHQPDPIFHHLPHIPIDIPIDIPIAIHTYSH